MNREAAEAAAAAAAGGSGTTAPASPSSTAMPSFFDEFTGRVHYDLTEVRAHNTSGCSNSNPEHNCRSSSATVIHCINSDWVEPSLPTYTPGIGCEPVKKFCCRGRVGRGGRVIFDRVPQFADSDHCSDQYLHSSATAVNCAAAQHCTEVKHDDSTSDDATTSDIPAPPKRRPLTLSTQDPNVLTNILYKRGQPTTAAEKLVALATAVSAVPQPSDQAPLRVNSWKIRELYNAADDQEELFEPLSVYPTALDTAAAPRAPTDTPIQYTFQV
eukprot:15864-Heterococcus_DN1.PRE.7